MMLLKSLKYKKIGGFLVTINMKKVDLLDHDSPISTLEKYGFGKKFHFMGTSFTKRSGVVCY